MLASMIASAPALETKIAFLRNLCGHGDEAIETHFAWLFLVDGYAWKLRKPSRATRWITALSRRVTAARARKSG
jgi:aminoglycoside phosphotransferase family enzyme